MLKILFADDHNLVRENVSILLQGLADEVVVLEAKSLDEALELASGEAHLDLIILDLFMPGMNHFKGLEAMKSVFPHTPLVILTGNVEPKDAFASLEHGAAGYIPKTIGSKALLSALRLVLTGEKYLPTLLLSEAFNAKSEKTSAKFLPMNKLTKRELQVLSHLADGHPNKEIARRLDVQEVTVKVHLKRVFQKLGVQNRTQAVRQVMKYDIREEDFKIFQTFFDK